MTQFKAKLQPKFYKGDQTPDYSGDNSKAYFSYMEKEYIHDGTIDSLAFQTGLANLAEPPADSVDPTFAKAREDIIGAGASVEETAFALWMAASYHDMDPIDWKSYFAS